MNTGQTEQCGLATGWETEAEPALGDTNRPSSAQALSTLLVPIFYDSIEITRDRAIAKFHRRSERRNPFLAFVLTLLEAIMALLLLR